MTLTCRRSRVEANKQFMPQGINTLSWLAAVPAQLF